MISILSYQLRTPCGGLAETLAALSRGQQTPRLLLEETDALIDAVCQPLLSGVDRILISTSKGDCSVWADAILENLYTGGPAELAQRLEQRYGIQTCSVGAACASGPVALAEAARILETDAAKRILVLGVDRIAPFISEGFEALQAIDHEQCRPFDEHRAGLQLGETIAALVLEKTDQSQPNRELGTNPIYLQGWGCSMDANHITAPRRDGAALSRACKKALGIAGHEQPDVIVAHGTGTRYNDDSESMAYAACAPGVPVCGWKGVLGHSLGACGITEVVLAAEVLVQGHELPGTAHTTTPACVAEMTVLPPGVHGPAWQSILSTNAGFAGLNGAVCIGTTPSTYSLPQQTRHRVASIHLDAEGYWTDVQPENKQRWPQAGVNGQLPQLTAKMIRGHADASWGRMDKPCRALVTCCTLLPETVENTALILASDIGSACSDRAWEEQRRAGHREPQRFAYTLSSTPLGEASIRCGITGPGFVLANVDDGELRASAQRLLADGYQQVICARIECALYAGSGPDICWAELWE